MSWISLFIFLGIGIFGLWLSYGFWGKKGLNLFAILISVFSITLYPAIMFKKIISLDTIFIPLLFLALLVCFKKYGQKEAKNMFFLVTVALGTILIVNFVQAIFVDSALQIRVSLTWEALGQFVAIIAAVVASAFFAYFENKKLNFKSLPEYLKNAIYLFFASCVANLIFVIFAYAGSLSFVDILLMFLIRVVLQAIVCMLLGVCEMLFRKEFSLKFSKKVEEKTTEKEEEKTVEIEKETNKEVNAEEPKEEIIEEKKKSKKNDKDSKDKKVEEENINYDNL